jgi:hypothetical protein
MMPTCRLVGTSRYGVLQSPQVGQIVGIHRLHPTEDMLLRESSLPMLGMAVGEGHVHTGSPVAFAQRAIPPGGGRDPG